ncbi:uncharacterized protein K02A2.6-like [Malaya genurostris]|uniref:uncharacterized protein K02A2.6-like n=1 Tax=Malaya genurostris TaxID=325434 RepID=UPI0026F396E1|nr:uncharacterized protein K02A2.6-like [Malaya genurostris]
MLMFGRNKVEHDCTLRAVIDRLKEYDITINEKKCEIGRKEVMFMGHRLSSDGISPAEEKVDAIRRCRNPETVEELRSFLGLINYLGKFIPNLSTLTAPLRELLHKDVRFKWERKHMTAFEEVKKVLVDPKNLGYYSPYDETICRGNPSRRADASPVGIGAVLLQEKDGKKRAICYVSKGLSTAERAYAQNEREALALVWATERLEPYLRGLEFKLVTDHEPLKVMFGSQRKQCPRIERWALRLQSFRYKIVHVSGKANIADPLSRLPRFEECSTYDQNGESMLLTVLESATPSALRIEEIVEATVQDSELAAVKEALNTGRWMDKLKHFLPFRAELSTVNEIVMRNDRIVAPINLRKRIMKLAHIGHPGIERMKQRIRSKVWWPNIDREVEKTVKSCLECQLVSNSVRSEPLCVRELPHQPWQILAMDLLGPLPSGDSILVVIDLYSRYRITEILRSTKTENIIERLDKVFMTMGLLVELVSDNPRNFASRKINEFCATFGIEYRHTTPYWPQSNGEVERQNRSILKTLKIAELNGTDWRKDLQEANYVYSILRHPATGGSPAELVFGRKLRDWIPDLEANNTEDSGIRDHDKIYKQSAKSYYDAKNNAQHSDLQIQDRVLMRNLVPQNKLSSAFIPESAVVVNKQGNRITVQMDDGRRYRRNSAHLRKLVENREDDTINREIPNEPICSDWDTPNSTLTANGSKLVTENCKGTNDILIGYNSVFQQFIDIRGGKIIKTCTSYCMR